MKIDKIDKNFAVSLNLTRKDVKIYNACKEPFVINGLIRPQNDGDVFRRMPKEIAQTVSDGVFALHTNTAGGRVRFKTDSDYIAIAVTIPKNGAGKMSHFPFTGSIGFDLYGDISGKSTYIKTFIPPFDVTEGYQSEIEILKPEMREYTINFPLYSNVSDLKIILSENAVLLPPRKYKFEKPVAYYGSSITQGGCASRPGNSYPSIISRVLDCDYINLGFSGSGRGEREMAEYIASLDMSAFVFDYDYNALDADHLKATHKPMFDIIRKAHPHMPIICVSAPITRAFDDRDERREIIIFTVNEAAAAGDSNVYFINGADFKNDAYMPDSLSVDGCHPNDYGFVLMAEKIGKALEKVLK